MGTCLSKKKEASTSSPVFGTTKSASLQPQTVTLPKPKLKAESEVSSKKEKKQEGKGQVKKEIFIIKHRKSDDGIRERNFEHPPSDADASTAAEANVDAILLQCGKLSRSSSFRAASSGEHGRGMKRSGSGRSHDFDHCENDTTNATDNSDLLGEEEDDGVAGKNHHRLRQRRRSPSERRRRTPSRERDQQLQRSTSRERRVSRSPSRRSSDTTNSNNSNNNSNNNNNATITRPGKMVSVPPTVSSLAMDKSNNNHGGGIQRISVKRNVGGASPRSRSPARPNGNAANGKVLVFSENQQQQPSLSRNSSRKAEQSPYRRIPLTEVDPESLVYPQSANDCSSRPQSRPRKEIETEANQILQKTNADTNDATRNRTSSNKTKEQQEEVEEVKGQSSTTENIVLKTTVKMPSGVDNLQPQTLTRSRSSRRSRDLDFLHPETLMNPAQSYTSLLLEDIQNFHQKNNNISNNNNSYSNSNSNTASISLPACVAKACSILEAVANLNATSSSNLSSNHYGKSMPDSSTSKEQPFVESEVVVVDDVTEPSLQKYVTVNRDMEGQESSGSNIFTASGQKHFGFSSSSSSSSCSSWEQNSRLSSRECGFQGIGRGRIGGDKGVHKIPMVVTAVSAAAAASS